MKQAMSMGFLVAIIIVLTSFLLISGTVIRWIAKSNDLQAEIACEDSVALRAATALSINIGDQKKGGGEFKGSPLLCQTIDKKVSGNREEVKEIFASKMARCWEMFGEGKYVTSVFENTNQFSGESKCFMCYMMLVEDMEKEPISEIEFQNYLRETDYPKKEGMKYLDYFQYGGGPGLFVTLLRPDQGIKEDGAYAILFRAKSQKCKISTCASIFLAGLGIGGFGTLQAKQLDVAGFGKIAGGAALSTFAISQFFQDIFSEKQIKIDSVMLVDMNDETLKKAVGQQCVSVADVQGI